MYVRQVAFTRFFIYFPQEKLTKLPVSVRDRNWDYISYRIHSERGLLRDFYPLTSL